MYPNDLQSIKFHYQCFTYSFNVPGFKGCLLSVIYMSIDWYANIAFIDYIGSRCNMYIGMFHTILLKAVVLCRPNAHRITCGITGSWTTLVYQ